MNVFIIGSALQTAAMLDNRRLHKQIVECKQILSALEGNTKHWRNHPCTIQYELHTDWLSLYMKCLDAWHKGELTAAMEASAKAEILRPNFHNEAFFDQMKRRLYTKDPQHYEEWAHLGTSEINWYWVEGKMRYYRNGKRYEHKRQTT